MMVSYTTFPPPPVILSRKRSKLVSPNYYPSSLLRKKPSISCCSVRIGVQDFAEIVQNKVLVAATVSTAIGQLLKPFSSALLHGKDFDFKSVVRSGGFPSTHSAGVVAAATSLGLERGLSDSIFGMSVVFASIVMYDAQGVRRQVGNQAKVVNWILQLETKKKSNAYSNNDDPIDSESLSPLLAMSRKAEKAMTCTSEETDYSTSYFRSGNGCEKSNLVPPSFENQNYSSLIPLEESIGHTEVEVIAGALLGFLVSLAVYSVL